MQNKSVKWLKSDRSFPFHPKDITPPTIKSYTKISTTTIKQHGTKTIGRNCIRNYLPRQRRRTNVRQYQTIPMDCHY
ncbi:hypothetical protein [Microcoleus sp.]|uniref:hypothetical protein n=1 Tax=Microcoleus sp. TaxID=44472 RepID=UPI0035244BE0